MPTVIDSLIVTLGLDPSNFDKGRKEAAANFIKTGEAARKTGADIERSGKNAAQFISQLRTQVLALFAAFTAGRGLKDFIEDTATTDAAVGRLAKVFDTTSEALSSWRNLAVLTGGSVAGITGSIGGLINQFQLFSVTGESNVLPYFRALGVQIADNNGRMRDSGAILLDLADAFSKLDPARAAAYGQALGLDASTINILIQGRAAVQGLLDDQKRLGVITKEDAAAGAALQKAWGELQQSSTSLGRTLLTAVTPVLVRVLNALTSFAVWAREHKPLIEAAFIGLAAAAIAFAVALLAPLAPILAVAAAIGTLVAAGALLYDDWKTWIDGGKSLFGDFFTFIAALFSGSADDIRKAWTTLFGDINDKIESFIEALTNAGPRVLAAMKSAFTGALTWAKDRWNAVKGLFGGGSSAAPESPSVTPGAAPSAADTEAYIRQAAVKRGINPDVAVQVARSEGLGKYVGDRGSSFGPYQLHYGGVASGGMAVSGLGDEFTKSTGLDARDPSTTQAQIDYALDKAAKGGWSPWHGWKGAAFAGIGSPSAQAAAAASSVANDNRSTSSSSSEVHIGTLNVATQATDAAGVARDLKGAIRQNSLVTQANYGMN